MSFQGAFATNRTPSPVVPGGSAARLLFLLVTSYFAGASGSGAGLPFADEPAFDVAPDLDEVRALRVDRPFGAISARSSASSSALSSAFTASLSAARASGLIS